MNTSKLADMAEIVSSLAIVLTLIYLAIQTNQNTQAIQSASRQEMLNAELWVFEKIIQDPELQLSEGTEPQAPGLDAEQGRKQVYLFTAFFRIRENLWVQYKNDVIDEATWETYGSTLVGLLNQKGNMRTTWDRLIARGGLNRDFTDDIELRLVD